MRPHVDQPGELRFRLATPADVDSLHGLLVECGLDMRDRLGLTHWVPAYPRPLFEQQVAERNVYAIESRDVAEPVATFTISEEPPSYFDLALWGNEGEPALYATRLAVAPHLQGGGIGRSCIAAVERIAAERGCRSVRFDAVATHTALRTYYESLGYRVVGRYEAFGSEHIGFEKLVAPTMPR